MLRKYTQLIDTFQGRSCKKSLRMVEYLLVFCCFSKTETDQNINVPKIKKKYIKKFVGDFMIKRYKCIFDKIL